MNGSRRLAFCAAVGMTLCAVGSAYSGVTPTYALQPRSLTANDFHEVALPGLGDPNNSIAWSMQWYQNKLYVGTSRDELCVETAIEHQHVPTIPYPPLDPYQQAPCNPDPQALPLAAEIWSLDPTGSSPLTQTNWLRVYQSPYTVTITGTSGITMAPRDMDFRGMSVFDEADGTQALYVSGVSTKPLNGSNVPPPSLLRSTDGLTFTAVPADPGTVMGNINLKGQYCCLREQVNGNGEFYVQVSAMSGLGTVYASATPERGDNAFRPIVTPASQVSDIAFFNGHLYVAGRTAGPGRNGGGYSVWRTNTSCIRPQCHPTFTQLIPPGAGLGASGNADAWSMHVFTDTAGVPHLYVGGDGAPTQSGAELIRINQDDSWDLIMGNTRVISGTTISPTSGLPAGFGYPLNEHVWRMEDYNGVLYVGTYDASTLLKDADPSYSSPSMGFDLWASEDGLTFTPVTINGFGDIFSFGARTLQATPYGLFVGSADWDEGLRIWQGSIPSSALRLAPSGLRMEANSSGGITLTWSAPRDAVLFHVYRAAATQATVQGLPQAVWLPGPFTEIGTTRTPSYVDSTVAPGGHDLYYVVAQDASGALSQPSNAVSADVLR